MEEGVEETRGSVITMEEERESTAVFCILRGRFHATTSMLDDRQNGTPSAKAVKQEQTKAWSYIIYSLCVFIEFTHVCIKGLHCCSWSSNIISSFSRFLSTEAHICSLKQGLSAASQLLGDGVSRPRTLDLRPCGCVSVETLLTHTILLTDHLVSEICCTVMWLKRFSV